MKCRIFIKALICLFAMCGLSKVNVFAAGNSISEATAISIGTMYSGTISDSKGEDYYRFEIKSSGRVTLTAQARMNWIYYKLYDGYGNELCSEDQKWDSTTQVINSVCYEDLIKGTYYFVVEKNRGCTGNYSFKLSYENAEESFEENEIEDDNSMNNANEINLGVNYKGQIANNDSIDFYKFTLPASGRVTLTARARMLQIGYELYDSYGNELCKKYPMWNGTTQVIDSEYKEDLAAGTYYFVVVKSWVHTGNYSFNLSYSCVHVFSDWKVTKAATVFTAGSKSHKCIICGETEIQSIKKLKPTIKLSAKKKTLSKKKSYVLKISKLAQGDSVKSISVSKKKNISVKKVKKNQYKITAKKKGVSIVTVKLKSGKKATCKITVK